MTSSMNREAAPQSVWLDTPHRYGRISRGFHWLMAALFAWQFTGEIGRAHV